MTAAGAHRVHQPLALPRPECRRAHADSPGDLADADVIDGDSRLGTLDREGMAGGAQPAFPSRRFPRMSGYRGHPWFLTLVGVSYWLLDQPWGVGSAPMADTSCPLRTTYETVFSRKKSLRAVAMAISRSGMPRAIVIRIGRLVPQSADWPRGSVVGAITT